MTRWPSAERVRVPRSWHWLVPAAAIAVVGCQSDPLTSEPEPEGQFSASTQAVGVGADDWIVVFKDGTQDPPGLARRLVAANGGSIRFTYSHAIRGFAGNLPPQAIDAIQKNPNVAYVERDGVVTKTVVGSWGLDRIDQRDLPLSDSYSVAYDGTDVDVYIIDTGIQFALGEYGGRASSGYDFVDNDADASDCDGHGTHVAGTVGSTNYGVAKNVNLVAVRVLNCQGSGSYAGVIAGIDYVAANATGLSVANMSLGGGFSSSVNNAVNNAVASGVVFAVSSGNSSADACGYSPASAASAITVNSSTRSDSRSSFSNYGTCTDIFAPGSGITSTVMGGGTESWSGTSMASPHVAGVAALILDELGDVGPTAVWTAMQDRATRDKISSAGSGSANLLLFSGRSSGDPCASSPCPDVEVQWVSTITVKTNRGKNGSGTVTVQVVEVNGGPAAGVTVDGSWRVNNTEGYTTSSGVTNGEGLVVLSTGGIRLATDFGFCVTGLSGSVVDATQYLVSPPPCAEFQERYGDGGPVDPPVSAGSPADLVATPVQKGRNYRAGLQWSGGAAAVDVLRNGVFVARGIINSQSYNDNLGKSLPGLVVYRVCNAESDTECSEDTADFSTL